MLCAWWPQVVHARVVAAVSGPPSSVQHASRQQLAGLLSTGAPKPSQAGPQLPCKRYVDLWLSQHHRSDSDNVMIDNSNKHSSNSCISITS